jgi:polyisoprenoid-binding protein YceI
MKRNPKRLKPFFIAATLAVWATAPITGSTVDARMDPVTWLIDASRSEARFTVTKLGFSNVTGVFRESDGEIRYDADRPQASSVKWRVRVASVVTDATNRDRALQGRDYFDAERHPYLEFTSTAVRRIDGETFEVSGRLTMRGVTRPLVTVVRHVLTGAHPTFETAFEVDRYDFGIAGGSVMGRLIGRTADVRLVAAVVRRP